MYKHTVVSLLISCMVGVSYANTCPDMSKYTGTIPAGWHARFEQAENTSNTAQLERVIYFAPAKNGLRCSYQTETNKKFILSMPVSQGFSFKSMGNNWKYDPIDEIWECVHNQQHKVMTVDECAFTLEKES